MYIAKHKDIYIRGKVPSMSVGIKGEYRAILRGPDGREKVNTGWKPNTLLNNGLYYSIVSPFSIRGYMCLGDDGTAVDIIQTGLLGTQLGAQRVPTSVSETNAGSPNYEMITTNKGTWAPGDGTGTIREVAFKTFSAGDPATAGTIRFVLSTPIVKGALDQLVIEHRMTAYPNTGDVTGTIDISGEAYSYTMRHLEIDETPASFGSIRLVDSYHNYLAGVATLVANTESLTWTAGPTKPAGSANITITNGGALGTYYSNAEIVWDINTANHNISTFIIAMTYIPDIQVHIEKVSDGTPLTKENTHELTMNFRTYPVRYVP